MTYVTDMCEAILRGDAERAGQAASCALAAGTKAQQLLTEGVIPSVHELCRRFQAQECFVPELLVACRAMQRVLAVIRSRAATDGFRPRSQVLVITLALKDDEITGRLAADLLEGAGFDVIRSSHAASNEDRAQTWQFAAVAVVVLVVPTITYCREPVSWPPTVHAALEELRIACARRATKIILLGGPSNSAEECHQEAHVGDIANVVAAVEQLARRTEPA